MTSDDKTKILREAERLVYLGKFQHAINEYLKITHEDPNDVLTLNTVGDLYLRVGKIETANRTFAEVAEKYCKNSYLLKAIAVYKKILKNDSDNLEINSTLAALYVRQGLSLDARNQYLRVADLQEMQGNGRESLEAYEKAAELDPSHAPVQIKLAGKYMKVGDTDKAKNYLAAAARAQVKSGKISEALDLFKQAAKLDPVDIEVMRGIVECSKTPSELSTATDLLENSIAAAPDNSSLHEIMGQAFLTARDLVRAEESFQQAASLDEGLYEGFLNLSKAYLDQGNLDRAANCLDPIITSLISSRETERAVTACNEILKENSIHIPALKKLVLIFSSINDKVRYLDTLDTLSDILIARHEPQEAVEYLGKILRETPLSNKHLTLHRQAFFEAFPGMEYRPFSINAKEDEKAKREAIEEERLPQESGEGSTTLVEIDLLLNYGMRDKALTLLQTLEAEDPYEMGVHSRLQTIYRDLNDNERAAEQSLLMAALCGKEKDEKSLRRCLLEAQKLSPVLVESMHDLSEFAWQHGIEIPKSSNPSGAAGLAGGAEVDLSGDLSEAFLKHGTENAAFEEAVATTSRIASSGTSAYSAGSQAPAKTVAEQLEEVDFYLRLGFAEEAKAKLDEIAAANPDHPDLAERYEKLAHEAASSSPASIPTFQAEEHADEKIEILGEEPIDLEWDFGSSQPSESIAEEKFDVIKSGAEEPAAAASPAAAFGHADHKAEPVVSESQNHLPEGAANELFADLLAEIESPTVQQTTWEDFEMHFGLGTAYREMDLVEDAIKEFQGAIKALDATKNPREIIQCCGMLSNCFLQKGMPRSAIRWCEAGLNIPEISQHEALALKYDMGVAHSLAGDSDGALQWYGEIFGIDSGYRDVAQKIDYLKGNPDRHESGDAKP
jgi:tetratricopeptide (TPR) repeat protein